MKDDHLSEERARAVWLRAAQLQAEAAQRLEERSRLLAADESSEALSDEAGLSSDMVRTAAIEAGIAPEFVDLALAETDGSLETGKGLVGWKDRAATRLLGTDTRRLDVTRVVDASPGDVLKAMQHVLPQHPYLLSLRETVGEDPLDGAVLVFDVPAMTGLAFTSFAYKMSWADLKELRFVLRPMDEGARTEVLVSVPLERSRRINWIVGNVASGFTGLAGGFIGVVVAKGMALAGAAVAAPIAIGAAGLAVLGSKGIGASYRWGLRTGEEEITTLLKKVEVTCRMGGGFSPPAPPTSGASDILGLHNLLGLMALPAGLLLADPAHAQSPPPPFELVQPALFDRPEGQAVAWADFDRDGDLDLVVGFRRQPIALYRNENGVFRDVAGELGLSTGTRDTRSLSWGDMDGDGLLDLFVGFGRGGADANQLYRNTGDAFEDIAGEVGAETSASALASMRQVSWVDYDGDGDSDLFVAVRWGANQLLRNEGGRFVDVSAESGLSDPRRAVAAAWFDMDRDGDLDLFIANQGGDLDALYRNDGGVFVDIAGELGMARPGRPVADGSVGVSVCDFDADGNFDLYVPSYGPDVLYLGGGDGTFRDASREWGVDVPERSVASDCGDFDNDGHVDLYVTAYVTGEVHGRDRLFRSAGARFEDVFPASLHEHDGDHGVRWADFDGDGDLDLAVANRNARVSVWRNLYDGPNRSVSVVVLDGEGRHTRQGSEIRVYDAGSGALLASHLVDTGGGYVSQNLIPAHLGVGAAGRVDVEVVWPSGGSRESAWIRNVAVDPVETTGLEVRIGIPWN
jgi:hypothetical protein